MNLVLQFWQCNTRNSKQNSFFMASCNNFTLNDDYEHLDEHLDYILESELQADDGSEEFLQLKNLWNSKIENECSCTENCETCKHGNNYIYDGTNIILNENRASNDLIYECSESCACHPSQCINNQVQRGPRRNLKIVDMENKGLGLITLEQIPKNCFIAEYAGEILTKSEVLKRHATNKDGMNFIVCLNEIAKEQECQISQTFIDPIFRGNIGRYLNHSCDPNCTIYSVRSDCIIPKLGS